MTRNITNNRGTMDNKTLLFTNPYSGMSARLTKKEAQLYMQIKNAEVNEDYETMQTGLREFSRLNPSAYMTLLD